MIFWPWLSPLQGWDNLTMTFLGKFGYIMYVYKLRICDALRDFVPFVQFKKREKHPWRSVTFNKVAG